MANRIKGITVEIGGGITGLQNALKGDNSSIRTTQSSLKDVNKLLKLDPTNTVYREEGKLKELSSAAKANNLKPYDYFKYLLEEIPKHREDTDRTIIEKLLPWSPDLPSEIRKPTS